MARPVPVLCATILLGALLAPAFADDLAPEALLEQRAPAVVSLRFVLKSDGTESPTEAHGTVVDPTGLVVLPNDELGGEGVKVSDLKVIFGNDPKEWEAVVVARDKNLSPRLPAGAGPRGQGRPRRRLLRRAPSRRSGSRSSGSRATGAASTTPRPSSAATSRAASRSRA